jgi:hypothetical protein
VNKVIKFISAVTIFYLVFLVVVSAQSVTDAERLRNLEARLTRLEVVEKIDQERLFEHTELGGHEGVAINRTQIAVLSASLDGLYKLLWTIVGAIILNILLTIVPALQQASVIKPTTKK